LSYIVSTAAAAAAGKTLDRDFYMSPEDARAWGLVDSVIEHRPLETAVSS
jgi:ATP-dependent protease ClpP protease subunit